MPENGTGRLDDHEQRSARPEAARRELEDSFIVMTHPETKAAARVREHAEFLANHEQLIESHAKFIASEQAVMEVHNQKMSEFDDKLNALIAIVSRMQGGMESRPS